MNYTKECNITKEKLKDNENLFKGKNYRLFVVLESRLCGFTLSKISTAFGLTTERIRQMEAKAVEILRVFGKLSTGKFAKEKR